MATLSLDPHLLVHLDSKSTPRARSFRAGALTVGVVTKPFRWEGKRRTEQADEGIAELQGKVDTLIVISNDKLTNIIPDGTPINDAFLVADDILRQGVVGISEIIIKPGLINVDFADADADDLDTAGRRHERRAVRRVELARGGRRRGRRVELELVEGGGAQLFRLERPRGRVIPPLEEARLLGGQSIGRVGQRRRQGGNFAHHRMQSSRLALKSRPQLAQAARDWLTPVF